MKNLNILVPVDFSDLSYQAFKAAEILAEYFDGTITPFHAYIPITDIDGSYYMGLGVATQTATQDLEPILEDRLQEVAREYINEKFLKPSKLGVGNPAHAIVEESGEYDLIVMSTHGRTGFSRMLMGSTAEKVLRLSHKPVLIIEQGSHLMPLEKILLTTDLSKNSEAAFPYARQISEASGARIELIHIVSYDDFDDLISAQDAAALRNDRLQKLVEKHFNDLSDRCRSEVILSSESPHEAIHNLCRSRNYNLVIMSTIGRTGLKYLTMGSTTANVVRMVNTAVLSINPSMDQPEQIEHLGE
ncbi:MAG TPA: universal stress protein [Balneolales bacterium]|nr:universal stress protein [Balneolales bacterium]